MGAKQTKKKGAYYPSKAEKAAQSKYRDNNQASTSASLPSIPVGTQPQQNKYSMFQVGGSQPNVSVTQTQQSDSEVEDLPADDGYSQVMVKDGKIVQVSHQEVDKGKEDVDASEDSESESNNSDASDYKEDKLNYKSKSETQTKRDESEDSEEESDIDSSENSLQPLGKVDRKEDVSGIEENVCGNDTIDETELKSKENTDGVWSGHMEGGMKLAKPVKGSDGKLCSKSETCEEDTDSESFVSSLESSTDLGGKDDVSFMEAHADRHNVADDTRCRPSTLSDPPKEAEETDQLEHKVTELPASFPLRTDKASETGQYADIREISDLNKDNQWNSGLKHGQINSHNDGQQVWEMVNSPHKEPKQNIASEVTPETPRSVSSYESGKQTFPKRRPSWLRKLKSLKQQSHASKSSNAPMYGRSVSVPNFPETYSEGQSAHETEVVSSSRSSTPRSKLSASFGNLTKKLIKSISKKDADDEHEMNIGAPVLQKSTRDLQHITGKKITLIGLSPTASEFDSDMVAGLDLDKFEIQELKENPVTVRQLPSDDENSGALKSDIANCSLSHESDEMVVQPTDQIRTDNGIPDDSQSVVEKQTIHFEMPDFGKSFSSNSSDVFLPDEIAETMDSPTKDEKSNVHEETIIAGGGNWELRPKEINHSIQTPSEANFDAIHWPSLSSVAVSQNGGSVPMTNDFKGLQTIDNLRNRRYVSHSLEDIRKPQFSLSKDISLSSEQLKKAEKEKLKPVGTQANQKESETDEICAASDSCKSFSDKVISNEPSVVSSKLIPEIHFRKRSASYSSDSFYSTGNDLKNEPNAKEGRHKFKHNYSSVDTYPENMSKLLPSNTLDPDCDHDTHFEVTLNGDERQISTDEYVKNWVVQSMSHMERLESIDNQSPNVEGLSESSVDDENSSSENKSEAESVQSVVEKHVTTVRMSSDIDQVNYNSAASRDYSTDDVIYAPQSTSTIFTYKNFNHVKKEGERIVLVNMPPRSPEFRKSESNDSDKLRSTLDKSLRTSQSVSDILETESVGSSPASSISSNNSQNAVSGKKQSESVSKPVKPIGSTDDVMSSSEPVQLRNADDILKYSMIKDEKAQQSVMEESLKSTSSKKTKGPAAVTETFQNILHWGSSRIRKSFQRLKSSKKDQEDPEPKKTSTAEEETKRIAFLKDALDPNMEAIFVGDTPHSSRVEHPSGKPMKINIKRTVSNIEVFSKSKFCKHDPSGTTDETTQKVNVITRTPVGYFTIQEKKVSVVDKVEDGSVTSDTPLETASDSELEMSSQRKDPTYSKLTILEKTAEGRVMFDPTSPRKSPKQRKVPPPRPSSLPLRRKATHDSGQNSIYATIVKKGERKFVKQHISSSDSEVSDSDSKFKPPVPPKLELCFNQRQNSDPIKDMVASSQGDGSDAHESILTTKDDTVKEGAVISRENDVLSNREHENEARNEFVTPNTAFAQPLVPPRRKKMEKQTSVVSNKKSGIKPELPRSSSGSLKKDTKNSVEIEIAKKDVICDVTQYVGDYRKNTAKLINHRDISSECQSTVGSSWSTNGGEMETERQVKDIVLETTVSGKDFQSEIPENTEPAVSKEVQLKTKTPPARPSSLPQRKVKKIESHKTKRPKENYKDKYKGSSLIQSRRADDRSISSQCSTDRSARVVREVNKQLSISSLDTSLSSEVLSADKKGLESHLDTSSQDNSFLSEAVTSHKAMTTERTTVVKEELKEQIRNSNLDNSLSSEIIDGEKTTRVLRELTNQMVTSGHVTSSEVTPSMSKDVEVQDRGTLQEQDGVPDNDNEVPRKEVEVRPGGSNHESHSSGSVSNTIQRGDIGPGLEQDTDDPLAVCEIPLTLQPKNRIPLRVKRRYPQYFEVPDDCDSLHSDSTECLSDIDPDMEPGFYPAGLFEHVAKMSRLPDPEDMPLGDTPNVPPVRIRRNFTTNSGKDMIIDTLDLPKSQVKSVTGQVPPQIAQIPPTPDIVQRDKTGVLGAGPSYEPGPKTSRKLSIEKDFIKERMRRRDSESSTTTALSQFEVSSNKENKTRDSTPESRDRHHKKSRRKHKKHRHRDQHRKRESSPEREKEKDRQRDRSQERSNKGHRGHKKHRSRSHERQKSKPRSRSVEDTDSTLVNTVVSAVSTDVQKKDSHKKSGREERSRKDKNETDKRRSRSHSHRRSKHTSSKDSVKSESLGAKGRNMRALPQHKFTANARPNNTELLDMLMKQQYEHQVAQEAHMAAKVLVNKAYTSPEHSHRTKDKKIQEILNDAYPLSQRSLDSAKDSASLPPMSPTPAASVQTDPSGRRNRPRQRSQSPPRAGSALQRLLIEGSLVDTKQRKKRLNRPIDKDNHRPSYPSPASSYPQGGNMQARWASYPGLLRQQQQPLWGGNNPQPVMGIEREVLLNAIREEIRLIHGTEAASKS